MSQNKTVTSVVIVGVVVALVAFYGGMKYGQGTNTRGQFGTGNFSPRNGAFATSTGRGGGRMMFGGAVNGQILSLDSNSLTIKSQDGGSRIVFLSASTTISRMSPVALKDLTVGSTVFVTGSANPDNSVNAQMIQIRP